MMSSVWNQGKGKGKPGALKLPHMQGPGMGPTIIGVLYAALPCFLHKRLFPGLEPTQNSINPKTVGI
ncbi:hypothetical protein MTR_3g045730 [Medicago truncatula]|uniref:Uncharacterized protein n=1 Tax=Medicago truncatula TaxID=3880 RepID=A0A072UUN5_MEDTR|nr:hypothetical protein MTR_3g045730 [Medicago truncatula]